MPGALPRGRGISWRSGMTGLPQRSVPGGAWPRSAWGFPEGLPGVNCKRIPRLRGPLPGMSPLEPIPPEKLPSAWRPNGPAAHRCSGELMGWDRQGGRALARAPWHLVSRARSPHGVAVVTALATAGDGLCGPKPSSTHPGRGQGSSPAQSPMARRPGPSPAAAQRNPCAGT